MDNPIHIYNSLTRKKEVFEPINPPRVKMYVCGPTVYDQPHIGHARSAYIFDVIRRYFAYKKYKVVFVRNVTDVDDKIIDKAKKDFPGEDLNAAAKKVSDKYLAAYHDAMKLLGILEPDFEPKATEYVCAKNPAMQAFIQSLIDRGAAYVSGGDVYFDIKKAKDYGKLSNQAIGKMESGARVAPGEKKNDPLDFALWKSAKEGEPSWDSPWGKGRPGWHIECSVMSSDILGDEFDIHGGGLDLIFPHHENEIAQSEGAGNKFARIWMHHGLLTINNQKMAKSLGNFITVSDFVNEHATFILKLLFLAVHYRSPLDYNDNALHAALENAQTIGLFFREIKKYNVKVSDSKETDSFRQRFIAAMDDDFNTSVALSILFDMITEGYKAIEHNNIQLAFSISKTLEELLDALGLIELKEVYESIGPTLEEMNIDLQSKYKDAFVKYGITAGDILNRGNQSAVKGELTDLLLELRNAAREKKDFILADSIREDLSAINIILEDNKDGSTAVRRKLR